MIATTRLALRALKISAVGNAARTSGEIKTMAT
jgi:hypothetical protein